METKKNKKKMYIIYIISAIIIVLLAVLIPLGFSEGYDSANVYIDNSNSSVTGKYLKDAIDDLNYYAKVNTPKEYTCKSNTPKCIRATTLHTEMCYTGTTERFCLGPGYALYDTITYGNQTTTEGVLTTGDAFDCDIDGTGYNHRFYYVSDYFDTSTKNFNDKVAVLIYYASVRGGVVSTEGTAYDCTNKNYNGPVTAREQLPTTSQWTNIRLYKDTRQILTQTNENKTAAGKYSLPTAFRYSGYADRLLTYQEVYHGCNSFDKLPTSLGGLDEKCLFLLEGTGFSNNSSTTDGILLESPETAYVSSSYVVGDYERNIYAPYAHNTNMGVRPAIEILKSEILY